MLPEKKMASIAPEEIQEMPLVELAYHILASTNEPFYYRDLMKKVAEWRKMSDEQVEDAIAKLYTDINIDGRFLCIGENVWGLRRWYPIERMTERGASKRFVRKEVVDDEESDELDEEFELEEEDLIEEEPYVFEDEDVVEAEELEEEDGDFLEESEVEEELDEEDQDAEEEDF